MFFFKRHRVQKSVAVTQKEPIGHLVGSTRIAAMRELNGKSVEYIAMKAGEPIPPSPPNSYVVCYDSVTDHVISAV